MKKPWKSKPGSIGGFTLLEVMVAVAIVAVGLAAAFGAVNQVAGSTILSRDRTLANWIAMNRLTELRLAADWPELGESDGEVEYAGQLWRWNIVVSETVVASLRRIDVSVGFDNRPEETVFTISGFLGPDGPPPSRATSWQLAPPGQGGT